MAPFQQSVLDRRVARRGEQCREPVEPGEHLVRDLAGLDMARPADHRRHAERAFPIGILLAAERCRRGVRPGELIRTVVGRVDHDRIIGDLEIVQGLEKLADVLSCSHMPSAYSLPGMPLWPASMRGHG